MKLVAQVSCPAVAFGSQPSKFLRLAGAVAFLASAVAARSKSSTTTGLSGVLSAPLRKPDCAVSDTNWSAGLVVSPSRWLTTVLYSRRVRRRIGEASRCGRVQSKGSVVPPPTPPVGTTDPRRHPGPDPDVCPILRCNPTTQDGKGSREEPRGAVLQERTRAIGLMVLLGARWFRSVNSPPPPKGHKARLQPLLSAAPGFFTKMRPEQLNRDRGASPIRSRRILVGRAGRILLTFLPEANQSDSEVSPDGAVVHAALTTSPGDER